MRQLSSLSKFKALAHRPTPLTTCLTLGDDNGSIK